MATFDIPVQAWVVGKWTSQVLDISRQNFPSSGDNRWGVLRWWEDNTEDQAQAKVFIDIFNSSGTRLQTDLQGSDVIHNRRFNKSINLGLLPNIATIDIKVRFKLHSLTEQPIVSFIELNTFNDW